MSTIYKIKVTQKMCDKILKTNCDLPTVIPGTNERFHVHRNLHAAENGFEPFEIWIVRSKEILPEHECYNKGLYHYNEFIEIPTGCDKFAIHRNKTTDDDYYIKYESVPITPVDDMTPDWIFKIKNDQAVLCQ